MPVYLPSHAVIWVAALAAAVLGVFPRPPVAGPAVPVSGRITVLERGNKPATDVGSAVIWLEAPGTKPPTARTVEVFTEAKEFRPRVTVIPVGSTVNFPNNDPFNHNVFSRSEEAPFDLGLFGRKQSKAVTFSKTGLVRLYCNVHANMAAFVLVRDNEWFTQPGADGSFALDAVAPGKYALRAWHERAQTVSRSIDVGPRGLVTLDLQLDARTFKFVQHLNKFGQPYTRGGARY